MVFTSFAFFARCKGPDEFWRKRRIFRLAALFRNRQRNCYSIAIRSVHKALKFATQGRRLKREQIQNIWMQRLEAACGEHDITPRILAEGLVRSDILLNKKSLSNLAIWEPRTFHSLATIAAARARADGLWYAKHLQFPTTVLARGLYK